MASHRAARPRHLRAAAGLLLGSSAALLLWGVGPTQRLAAQDVPEVSERGIPGWTLHYGGFRSLQDIAALSPEEAWGLDAIETSLAPGRQTQTAFVHVSQGIWRVERFVEEQRLRALDLAGPDMGLAVGDEGAAWRFDGRGWRDIGPAPTSGADLRVLDLFDETAGWAAGLGGTMLRWEAGNWQVEPLPAAAAAEEIVDLAAVGRERAWAITHRGLVLRRESTGWSVDETAPEVRNWLDLAFRDPEHGLVAGRKLIERRDGAWQEIGDPEVRYRSPVWLGDTALLLANDRPVLYRDGVFSAVDWQSGPLGNDLSLRVQRWLVPITPTEAWAFGSSNTVTRITADGRGAWHWPTIAKLETVDALPDGRGWAGGRALVHGMVGGDRSGPWTTLVPREPGTTVSDLDMVSPTEGWAVGRFEPPGDPLGVEGRMWRWDGEAWRDWPVNKLYRMRRVQMLSADEGWASGDNVVVRWDGQAWSQVPGAPPESAEGDLSVVRGGDDPLAFFGAKGYIFRLSGEDWQAWTMASADLIKAVAAPSADEAWALARTTLHHYDGETWRDVHLPLPSRAILADIETPRPGEAWLLTEPPGLWHWEGGRWTEHDLAPLGRLSTPFRLRALRLEETGPASEVWLVGEPAMVARYSLNPVSSRIQLPWLGR